MGRHRALAECVPGRGVSREIFPETSCADHSQLHAARVELASPALANQFTLGRRALVQLRFCLANLGGKSQTARQSQSPDDVQIVPGLDSTNRTDRFCFYWTMDCEQGDRDVGGCLCASQYRSGSLAASLDGRWSSARND